MLNKYRCKLSRTVTHFVRHIFNFNNSVISSYILDISTIFVLLDNINIGKPTTILIKDSVISTI